MAAYRPIVRAQREEEPETLADNDGRYIALYLVGQSGRLVKLGTHVWPNQPAGRAEASAAALSICEEIGGFYEDRMVPQ